MWAKVKPHVYTVYCVFLLGVAGVLTNKSVENYLDWRFSNPVSLPTHALINGQRWNIVQGSPIPPYAGFTHCEDNIIVLLDSDSDEEKASSLTHELLHAEACYQGVLHNEFFNNEDVNHRGIYWAARHLTALLANNPQVSRYIERYGKKDDDGPPPTAIPLFTLSTLPGTPIAGPASRPVSGHHHRKAK